MGADGEGTTIYSWDSGTETGGTAAGSADGLVGARNANNTTIKLDGKADFSTNTVTITLDKALSADDKISVTAYRNKNAVDKTSGFKAKFEKGESTVASSTGLEFVNIDASDASAEDSNRGTEPNTCTFEVPTDAAGSKTITMTRSHQGTNLFITKIVITTPASGDEGGSGEGEVSFPITATWSFTDADVVAAAVAISGTSNSTQIENNGLKLTVEANGKTIRDNGNSIQTGDGVVFKVPVQGKKDEVTVVGYSSPYFAYSIAGVDATEATTKYTATAADVAQGYVEVVNKGQYLISISVTQNEDDNADEGGDTPATDVTATWDYSNAGVMEATMALSGSSAAGTVKAIEDNGILLTVEANGVAFRNNGDNIQVRKGAIFKVPVKNAGDLVTIKGYPGYSYYKVNDGDEITNTKDNPQTEYKAKASDATRGYVAITSNNDNNYFYSISVTQYAPKGATTLDNEKVTATFPFILGTAGQKATFTNADYWISSKVELGSNNSYGGTLTVKDATMTLIAPETQLAEAGETGDIRFIIRPKFGYTFTPTKVSLKASKVGTDNSTLDIAWMNPDKTTASLAKAIKPERNNVNGYSALEYTDFSTAKPGEGACGLIVTLYGLQKGKQLGIADVVIEGTLSGTEKEVPILGSFKINGNEYKVEDVFGDDYEADLKLSKKEKMVSSGNPLADITPVSGELGQVTYEGTETSCKVTIPMTAGEVSLNYVLNITQKPDYTLTYFDVEGNELPSKQTIEEDGKIGEFIYDIADISSKQNGFKARGWFKQNYVGAKYSVDDVVTSDLKLYAVETEIEVASLSKKYEFDLTDINFDAADHEAFNPTGGKPNVSDMRHGWNFKENDKIELLVGPKANIIITICQYPTGGTTKIAASNGQEVDAVSTTDGATQAIEYEGEAGTLTLTISGGQCYIHKIVIFNTAETNYDQKGQWIYVKQGDASSFLDAIDAANGMSGTERVFIYVPNGTYYLGQKTLTTIGRNNISIIGESMEGTIIKNRPEKEGIAITATLLNTATNTYLQDLTLDCIAPYGTGDDTKNAERGVCFQDKGNQTIMKNVYLKGLQDTYYSNNNSGTYYFEDCKIEGSVDYVCGNGDVYFNKTLFYTVNKSAAAGGAAGGVIAAPNTKKSFGYIFNECTLDGMANEDGKYRLGRPWASGTIVRMLNTTMLIKPTAAGWDEWSTDASKQNSVEQFAEYNSVDKDGNTVDLSQRKTSFKGVTNNPVITADEAANYTPEAIFNSTWKPATAAAQFDAPTDATLKDGTITWTAVEGAAGYAIFANDELLGITETTSYTITEAAGARRADGDVVYTIRTVNAMGGFGEARTVTDATAINKVKADEKIDWNNQVVYDLQGRRVKNASKGVFIINGHKVIIK